MKYHAERLLEAIGEIDETMVAAAAPEPAVPLGGKKRWIRWTAAAAACLALGLVGTRLLPSWSPAAPTPVVTAGPNGVYIPPQQVSLSKQEEIGSCMVAFFLYRGRSYEQYQSDVGPVLKGEYLGTATGLIDEWTPADGYVDLAGSVAGAFYAVQGYDPARLLLLEEDQGGWSFYLAGRDLTVTRGEDVLEDVFHLSRGLQSVTFETHESWDQHLAQTQTLSVDAPELTEFLRAVEQASCRPRDEMTAPDGAKDPLGQTIRWHIDLTLPDGLVLHLRLAEGGYVIVDGFWDVCFQLPKPDVQRFTDLLKRNDVP